VDAAGPHRDDGKPGEPVRRVWGALAVAALYGFIQFLTRNRWVAVLCAALLMVSRVEWSQSIIPRPYTLNSFFVIVLTWLFFLWRRARSI